MKKQTTTNAIISKLGRNCLGTLDIYMTLPGMRKEQDFCVYPISKGDQAKVITIQSGNRFGKIDLSTGRGLMSKCAGTYSSSITYIQAQIRGTLQAFTVTPEDVNKLKLEIFGTTDSMAGASFIYCDNSGAVNVL